MGSQLKKLRRALPARALPSVPEVMRVARDRVARAIQQKLGPPNEVTGTFSAVDERGAERMFYVVDARDGTPPRVFGYADVTVTIGGHPVEVLPLESIAVTSEVAHA